MIEYITNEHNQAVIYQTNDVEIKDVSNLTVVKQLCLAHLFTYEGYLKAVKQKLSFKYRIPIYYSKGLQLIATRRVRDYENIWINKASVESVTYSGNRIIVAFTSGRVLAFKQSRYAFKKQLSRLEAIKYYISKHFHV